MARWFDSQALPPDLHRDSREEHRALSPTSTGEDADPYFRPIPSESTRVHRALRDERTGLWEPEPTAAWTPILPLALAIFALIVFLNWNAILWVARALEHAEQAMAGPWG